MPPKGETKDQATKRRAKFYTAQRVKAEETGDQKTTDKIYSKLGKKSHSVDADAVNKGILGGVASTMGLRGLGKIGGAMRGAKGASAVGESAGASAGQKALTGGVGRTATRVNPGMKNVTNSAGQKALTGRKAVTGAKSAQKALPNAKTSSMNEPKYEKVLSKGGSVSPKMKSSLGKGTKPAPKVSVKRKVAA